MKHGDVIEIYWLDSCSETDIWAFEDNFDFESHDRATFYKTIGFFIKRTATNTYVCESMRVNIEDGGSSLGHLFSIPNCAITSTKVIRRRL